MTCAGCYIGADDFALELGHIFVESAASAWGALCVEGNEYWTVFDFQEHIASGWLTAIAEACVLAVAGDHTCLALAHADATVQ